MSTQTRIAHVRTVSEGSMKAGLRGGGCKECQASCQSACKTSCTVGNQVCRQRADERSGG